VAPTLDVDLVAAVDAADSRSVKDAATVHLGPLKGNQGDQTYDLPADISLATYRPVTVWCQRFNVNFAMAPPVGRRAQKMSEPERQRGIFPRCRSGSDRDGSRSLPEAGRVDR
jgi:hypothetical protein